MSTAELATSYAALILADDGVEITVRPRPPPPHARAYTLRWSCDRDLILRGTINKDTNAVTLRPTRSTP